MSLPAAKLMVELARDLSTCTEHEILQRWPESQRAAVDSILGQRGLPTFAQQVAGHNPIFYVAQKCFFDNAPDMLWAPLHRDILCADFVDYIFLEKYPDIAGLLELIQRDAFKSTFAHGALPLTYALRQWHLHRDIPSILLTHHKANQASDNLERLKMKMLHPWMKKVWPEFTVKDLKDCGTKYAFDWPCITSGRRAESSVMAAGMGARMTGYHFGLRINDDIVTEEHRDSKVIRDEAFDKYTAMRFLRDTRKSFEVNTGTPYHPNDLWSKLIRANVDGNLLYKSRLISAIDDDGNLSFPTRHTREYLEKIRQEEISRSGNDDYFQLQMLCRYRSTRMIAAQWEWIKHCQLADIPPTTYRCIFVDPAWKGTENSGEGDDACVAVGAFERRGSFIDMYVVDGVVSNEMTDAEGREVVFRFMKHYGVVDVAPEERGGKAFKQSLRNEAQTRGIWINVLDLKSQQTNKSQRITSFLGEAQAGRVWLVKEADFDFREKFEEQFRDFPQLDHDDVLDCLAYSRDIAVTERVVPQWNEHTRPWWETGDNSALPRRTRYCSL